MKKWLALFLVVLFAIAGYVAAGPYLTVRAIKSALDPENLFNPGKVAQGTSNE